MPSASTASKQVGNTGSKGGRPKGAKNARTLEIEAEARKHAGDAIKTLASIAKSGESEKSRVAAAIALLDRGYGRPRQAVEHSGPEGAPIKVQIWMFGDKPVAF